MSPVPPHGLLLLLAHKYDEGSAIRVVEDLRLNHNRVIAKAYVQTVADAVAAVAMGFGGAVELSSARTARVRCDDDWHRH